MVADVDHHLHGTRKTSTVANVYLSTSRSPILAGHANPTIGIMALSSFQTEAQKSQKWRPRYRCGPRVAVAPATPFKFLDIGTKMGCYKIEGHIPVKDDMNNIFHPRFAGEGIPPANTFHAIVHDRAAKWIPDEEVWCTKEAWFAHSPDHGFRVKDPHGYIWGLPVLVPTCPKKLFALGPRKKYVDIVTDTLHASSSDLITWSTLVMMKLNWIESISIVD